MYVGLGARSLVADHSMPVGIVSDVRRGPAIRARKQEPLARKDPEQVVLTQPSLIPHVRPAFYALVNLRPRSTSAATSFRNSPPRSRISCPCSVM